MGLYDNAWPSTYEEIKRFYPVWYRDVLEMDAIWRAQGRELDGVRATVEGLIDNGYILTADLPTIASLEEFLRIMPETGQSLDERRRVVAAYVRGREHIGAPEIRSIVGAFTAGAVDVGFRAGVISVKASRRASESFNLDGCLKVLHERIPAHLRLAFTDETENPQETTVGFAGTAGRISITRLPEWRMAHNFHAEIKTAGGLGVISTVTLPPVE